MRQSLQHPFQPPLLYSSPAVIGCSWIENWVECSYPAAVIALIDYGSGNLRSVEKALRFVGAKVQTVTRPEELRDAHGVVLPGVGAFDDCVNALRRQELLG